MNALRSFIKICIYLFFLNAFVLIFLELAYRYMVVDFYKPEFEHHNYSVDHKNNEIDLLVLGDSFSAVTNGYVDKLRDSIPNASIINASIVGIGIKQSNFILSNQLKKYNPKNILYQVYVGNDLIDLNYPTNWKKLSFIRNLYWTIAEKFRVISFINYRLGSRFKKRKETKKSSSLSFNKDKYTPRTKMYLNSNPRIYEEMIDLNSCYDSIFEEWKLELKKMISKVPDSTNIYIVFIPHCTQVNKSYLHNYMSLGMNISNEDTFLKEDYSFYLEAKNSINYKANITFLNPLKFLRENNIRNTYFENDPHFNNYGHELFAEYLKNKIL